MLSLGIIASSFQLSEGLSSFATGGTVPGTVNSLAYINGTAVISIGGTGSRYATDLFTTTTLGGASIDTPNSSRAANGVVLKTGRGANGTVTIARTSDGGQTWATALNVTRTDDRIESVAYAEVSGTARWIGPVSKDNDVYLSTDNGASFTAQANVLSNARWWASERMGSAFAVFSDSLDGSYYTSEIGTTWTLRTLPARAEADLAAFASRDDTTMFVAGSVVYTTSDLVNWSTVGTIPIGSAGWDQARLAYGNGNWVYANADGASGNQKMIVYYSINNGASWTQSTVTAEGSATFVSAIDYNSADSSFYIIGTRAGVNRVWRATT